MSFWERIFGPSKAGHDIDAYGCIFWAGDHAGRYDWRARCLICEPLGEKS